mgnify:CR=1 FL=1
MQKLFLIGCLLLLGACDYFKQEDPRIPIARVNDEYLYQEDVVDLVTQAKDPQDSARIVNNFINRWATQQLLIDQAFINLSINEQEAFDKLVEQYKVDLYTEKYKNNIVAQQLDSSISPQELQDYYQENQETFRINDALLQVRYIHLSSNFSNLTEVEERFKRFDSIDRIYLEGLGLNFNSYSFNDSIWVKKESLLKQLPVLKTAADEVLKKSNYTSLQDSLGVYLVRIEGALLRNDFAPIEFVTPTIEQIILNRRKLELIKLLEKDITKDAIKNEKFEVFPPR